MKYETVSDTCSGGCVDVWQVECKDKATTFVAAKVAQSYLENDKAFVVTTMGYKGSDALIGQADRAVSPFGSGSYSLPAWIKRPGLTQAATSALVKVTRLPNGFPLSPEYRIEFSCHDFNFSQIGNPTVTLLQDH